ncbi:MAG: type III pantothenate kinase [Nitrospirae bacterium YQR-1]
MLLAIDIGNTNVKAGIIGQPGVLEKISIPNESFRKKVQNPFNNYTVGGKITDIAVMSVVPGISVHVVDCAREYFGIEPVLITKATESGVKFSVRYPQKVGIDRVAVALAAVEAFKGPSLTVDFGTVTSISVMDGDGVFSGGALLPGIRLLSESLHNHTAMLPLVQLEGIKPSALGKDTEEAVLSGVFYGTAGAVDNITREIERELGYNISIAVTGGNAPLMESFLREVDLYDLNLSLKGLGLLYERLSKGI